MSRFGWVKVVFMSLCSCLARFSRLALLVLAYKTAAGCKAGCHGLACSLRLLILARAFSSSSANLSRSTLRQPNVW